MELKDTYTSTGHKFFSHQEVMANLRNGRGQPITCHVMATDVCNHSCAFCSVQARVGDVLPFNDIMGFIDILVRYGLKSCILSGGGNPILYKHGNRDFNDVVGALHDRGLEIGLITNGMPLKKYHCGDDEGADWHRPDNVLTRKSWKTVLPSTLDKLTWVRVSMSGLDHSENKVYIPNVDPDRTALGFSYVAHDIYREPADPHHGKVSRPEDLLSGDHRRQPDLKFEDRMDSLTDEIMSYVDVHRPRYVRLLPNCLQPDLIKRRCDQLEDMATEINVKFGREVAFVQYKPPKAPKACYLGYVHPVLNCDGYVYPCDSCVLNEAAGHTFANPWRVCHWSEIGTIYDKPLRSLIEDTAKTCPGCVFTKTNEILGGVVNGIIEPTPPAQLPEHVNFV